MRPLQWLGITWVDSTTWRFGSNFVSHSLSAALAVAAGVVDIKTLSRHRSVVALLHDAPVFLRYVVIVSEAIRRPTDFAGSEEGWDESRLSRELLYALQLHFGGPSLTTPGLWTQLAITRIRFHQHSEFCPRCNCEVETTMHRLWHCGANVSWRSLDDNCPGTCFPIGLPPCLARCGLIPANFEQRFGFSSCDVQAMLDYLSAVYESTTLAISNSRSG